jgi:hypothetical protein
MVSGCVRVCVFYYYELTNASTSLLIPFSLFQGSVRSLGWWRDGFTVGGLTV